MVAIFYKWVLNLQAHHQEILQKTTPQYPLTDTTTDRRVWNGPSYAPSHQVRISVIFETRAHTRDTTTGSRMCDGPSSGYRRAINEINPTRPGWTPFQNLTVYTPIPPYSTPLLPLQLPLISTLFSTSTLPPLPQSPQPYYYQLLVGAAVFGIYLATWIIPHLCFLHFQGMCL